jgi:hypothetical protein
MVVDLAEASKAFETWRATRKNQKSRIPDELWDLACRLAKEHGTNKVAKLLRLPNGGLASRCNPPQKVKRTSRRRPQIQVTPLLVHPDKPLQNFENSNQRIIAEFITAAGLKIRLFEGIAGDVAKSILAQAVEAP